MSPPSCILLLHTYIQGSVTLLSSQHLKIEALFTILPSDKERHRLNEHLPFKSVKPMEKVLFLCEAGTTSGASAADTKLCNKIM